MALRREYRLLRLDANAEPFASTAASISFQRSCPRASCSNSADYVRGRPLVSRVAARLSHRQSEPRTRRIRMKFSLLSTCIASSLSSLLLLSSVLVSARLSLSFLFFFSFSSSFFSFFSLFSFSLFFFFFLFFFLFSLSFTCRLLIDFFFGFSFLALSYLFLSFFTFSFFIFFSFSLSLFFFLFFFFYSLDDQFGRAPTPLASPRRILFCCETRRFVELSLPNGATVRLKLVEVCLPLNKSKPLSHSRASVRLVRADVLRCPSWAWLPDGVRAAP